MLLGKKASGAVGFLWCLVSFVLLSASFGVASAQDIDPGLDLFITDGPNTSFDFGGNPIPADFFDPGSDPFTGVIDLQGFPLPLNTLCPPPPTLCPYDDLSLIDTIVERQAPAPLPTIGASVTVPIEIVQLSLVSVDPIVVTYSGGQNPEYWDVDVCLSPTPSPTGSMTITKTHANGGTFDSVLPVTPRLVFTRVTDSQQRVLDGGVAGLTDNLQAFDVPWMYDQNDPMSCRSNFCIPDPFIEAGLLATHGLLPSCGLVAGVPVMPGAALIVLAVAMVAAGIRVMKRFGKKAGHAA